MRLEWDERKNRINIRKHGFPLELAAEVFDDPLNLTVADKRVEGELRFRTTGCIEDLRILVVAHTTRWKEGEEVIRVISARKATPAEKRAYEEAER